MGYGIRKNWLLGVKGAKIAAGKQKGLYWGSKNQKILTFDPLRIL